MAKLDERIGFLGGGNMAFAIGSGLIGRSIVKPSQVTVSGPHLENLVKWKDLGAAITEDNGETVTKSDIIFICVKPHLLNTLALQVESSIASDIRNGHKVFVSVLAGTNLEQLETVSLGMFPARNRTSFETQIDSNSRHSRSWHDRKRFVQW